MLNPQQKFEIEFRCHFIDAGEAFEALPFLRQALKRSCNWKTAIHDLKLFRSGQLLRTAEVSMGDEVKSFLGWKGPDKGQFANIRQEIDEEISKGITDSVILKFLGNRTSLGSADEVLRELEQTGHAQFMSFQGSDISGRYEPDDISLKLMNCAQLKWPLLVEIEKTANSLEEALICENKLYEIGCRFQLLDRVVREEPPTLLYERVFAL